MKGGGIGIYISENIHYTRLNKLEKLLTDSNCLIECIVFEIKLEKHKLIIFTIYNPPQNQISQVTAQLKFCLINIQSHYPHHQIIFIGDFNVDIAGKKDHASEMILNTFQTTGFVQLINNCTRITPTTSTIIDHIYINNISNILNHGTEELGISDHCAIHLTINTSKIKLKKHAEKYVTGKELI